MPPDTLGERPDPRKPARIDAIAGRLRGSSGLFVFSE